MQLHSSDGQNTILKIAVM